MAKLHPPFDTAIATPFASRAHAWQGCWIFGQLSETRQRALAFHDGLGQGGHRGGNHDEEAFKLIDPAVRQVMSTPLGQRRRTGRRHGADKWNSMEAA